MLTSLDKADEYFSGLNPIAKRISIDIHNMKETYGELWYTFSTNEQNEIINETFINPEICLKYFDKYLLHSLVDSSPQEKADICATDAEIDDNWTSSFGTPKLELGTGEHRDEHAGPFSYRTKSQLSLFHKDNKIERLALKVNAVSHMKSGILNVAKNVLNDGAAKSSAVLSELNKYIDGRKDKRKAGGDKSATEKLPSDRLSESAPSKATNYQAYPKRNFDYASANYAAPSSNNAVYSDVYCEYEENSELIKDCGSANNVSANASDEDHFDYEYDDKILCEDVKLLDNEASLKKGFDFLNNW